MRSGVVDSHIKAVLSETVFEPGAINVERIKQAGGLIKKRVNSHPTLKADCNLLLSIPGIGEATTARLLPEIMILLG